ncbi:anaphase-promoting complex subunit Apc11 [Pleurotus eryngii]|uniref:Anaphase-promoting complex subunit 11 n=1 Tax=Pleurotus eryngii TaxID=5323 RepID=A0A9P5ZMM3_PLEER|nr:anaphase-promoting complex subunit Apc11 [Pleurotus eryngii]
MKVKIKQWNAVAQWRWDTGNKDGADDGEGDVCGICRVPFEGCCPSCKVPGDDCPLIWGECSHVFHMHCLLKWIGTAASKQQCPMDRRPWATAERRVDNAPPPTT